MPANVAAGTDTSGAVASELRESINDARLGGPHPSAGVAGRPNPAIEDGLLVLTPTKLPQHDGRLLGVPGRRLSPVPVALGGVDALA